MEQQSELRASDQDRQKVADRLRDAVNEGRIDLFEYDERLAAAYAAKTYGDLAGITADLPEPEKQSVVPVAGAPLATERQIAEAEKASFERRRRTRHRLWGMWRPWAAASIITTGIWLATVIGDAELKYFWPVWVIVPWGFVLLAQSFGGGRRDWSRSGWSQSGWGPGRCGMGWGTPQPQPSRPQPPLGAFAPR
jgi:Domain of unknown function (DUF1707).